MGATFLPSRTQFTLNIQSNPLINTRTDEPMNRIIYFAGDIAGDDDE